MGAFFALSGFLAGASLLRRTRRGWARRRLVQIGVPTVFGMTVIVAAMRVILAHHPAARIGPPLPPFDWYHRWFLVALLLYLPFAVLACRLDERHGVLERAAHSICGARHGPARLLVALAAWSLALMMIAAVLVAWLAPPDLTSMLGQCRFTAGYLPMYLFGFALSRSAGLRGAAMSSWQAPAAMLARVATVYLAWFVAIAPGFAPHPRWVAANLLMLVGGAVAPPAAFALIFRSAVAIRRVPVPLRRLSGASFTIYLVHVPVMTLITAQLA